LGARSGASAAQVQSAAARAARHHAAGASVRRGHGGARGPGAGASVWCRGGTACGFLTLRLWPPASGRRMSLSLLLGADKPQPHYEAPMDNPIERLFREFDNGRISRRDLLRALGLAALAVPAVSRAQGGGGRADTTRRFDRG